MTLETCPMVSCVTGSSLVQMLPSVLLSTFSFTATYMLLLNDFVIAL